MTKAQRKGKIFEEWLKIYLKKQGYTVIPEQIRDSYGVPKRADSTHVKGRGGWHQIDALGQFEFQIPFVYPIRLLSEAKCWKKNIGLPVVRNFVGVLKDISENYFIEKYRELGHKDRFRFTDCGVIFSVSDFTKEAQMYAYAQGIYLIQVQKIAPLIEELARKKTKPIRRYFPICYFALASGLYPILILSKKKFPLDRFVESDEVDVKIHYGYEEHTKNIHDFRIESDGWEGRFQLPRYIWRQYMQTPGFRKAMLDMKRKILNHIDIPLKIRNIRRIIKLKLDKSWLDTIENKWR